MRTITAAAALGLGLLGAVRGEDVPTEDGPHMCDLDVGLNNMQFCTGFSGDVEVVVGGMEQTSFGSGTSFGCGNHVIQVPVETAVGYHFMIEGDNDAVMLTVKSDEGPTYIIDGCDRSKTGQTGCEVTTNHFNGETGIDKYGSFLLNGDCKPHAYCGTECPEGWPTLPEGSADPNSDPTKCPVTHFPCIDNDNHGNADAAACPMSSGWRITNLDHMQRQWVMGELNFYSDEHCTHEVTTACTAEDLVNPYEPACINTLKGDFNGVVASTWYNKCGETDTSLLYDDVCDASSDCCECPDTQWAGGDWPGATAPRGTYIGYDFNKPVQVMCVRACQSSSPAESVEYAALQYRDEEGTWCDAAELKFDLNGQASIPDEGCFASDSCEWVVTPGTETEKQGPKGWFVAVFMVIIPILFFCFCVAAGAQIFVMRRQLQGLGQVPEGAGGAAYVAMTGGNA